MQDAGHGADGGEVGDGPDAAAEAGRAAHDAGFGAGHVEVEGVLLGAGHHGSGVDPARGPADEGVLRRLLRGGAEDDQGRVGRGRGESAVVGGAPVGGPYGAVGGGQRSGGEVPLAGGRGDQAGAGGGGGLPDRPVEGADGVGAPGELVEQQLGPRVVQYHAYGGQRRVELLRHEHGDGGGEALADLLARQPEADGPVRLHGERQQGGGGRSGQDEQVAEVDQIGRGGQARDDGVGGLRGEGVGPGPGDEGERRSRYEVREEGAAALPGHVAVSPNVARARARRPPPTRYRHVA